jgi:hypothetical protein
MGTVRCVEGAVRDQELGAQGENVGDGLEGGGLEAVSGGDDTSGLTEDLDECQGS